MTPKQLKIISTVAVMGILGFALQLNSPSADKAIEQAYKNRASDLIVTSIGTIVAVLKDDNTGARHQRLIVELASGHSLLIAHNIDLAERINTPTPGTKLGFKGEYEWNEKGGVIHWTHRDPDGNHPAGWIEYQGDKYW